MIYPEPSLALFKSGELLINPDLVTRNIDPRPYLLRHLAGKWESMPFIYQVSNAHALEHGKPVLSHYEIPGSVDSICLMTESDRSFTVIFLSSVPVG